MKKDEQNPLTNFFEQVFEQVFAPMLESTFINTMPPEELEKRARETWPFPLEPSTQPGDVYEGPRGGHRYTVIRVLDDRKVLLRGPYGGEDTATMALMIPQFGWAKVKP